MLSGLSVVLSAVLYDIMFNFMCLFNVLMDFNVMYTIAVSLILGTDISVTCVMFWCCKLD